MARRKGRVHVAVTRRHYRDRAYEAVLLRRSYREGGKVKNETLGNIPSLGPGEIEGIRAVLAGRELVDLDEALAIERSLAHGHVDAVLGVLRDLDLERLISRERSRERDLVVAMICQRLIGPGSKLSATRRFSQTTLASELSLGEVKAGRDGLALRAPRADREGAGQAPPGRRGVHALRPLLELRRGPLLPAREARLLPRRRARQAPGQLPADLLARGAAGRDLRPPRLGPPTSRRCRARSRRSAGASGSKTWSWSATAAC